MKKTARRLAIRRDTVRVLATLHIVHGGDPDPGPDVGVTTPTTTCTGSCWCTHTNCQLC